MSERALELLEGAGDVHVHTSPSLVPNRRSNVWELIAECEKKRMAFAVVKWHHGDSFSAASVVNATHRGPFRLYGGLVLNRPAGGLNPYAVDCAVTLGAKIVWLPTLDAAAHGEAIGQLGGFPFQKVRRSRLPEVGLRIVDESGGLSEQTREILSVLDGSDTVLATGHVGTGEIAQLSRYIERERLRINLLVNHVDFAVPSLSGEQISELASSKVWFELAYFTVSELGHSSIAAMCRLIASNPDAQFVLASDSGQERNPIGPEAMRRFVARLLENGVSAKRLDMMLHRNARMLLALGE